MAATADVRSSLIDSLLPTQFSFTCSYPSAPSVAQCASEAPNTGRLGPECSIARDNQSETLPNLPTSCVALGTPMRAIVPLPRRCRDKSELESAGKLMVLPLDAPRSPDADASEMREVDTLQSITATKAHSYMSFEELRVECYAQSLIARGAKPEPVPHNAPSWMIIPPMFSPCTVLRIR